MIKLEIPGVPIPQARLRMFKRGNKVMVYDPQTADKRKFKHIIQDQIDSIQ